MSKFKKILLAVLISCFAACAGLAVAACTNKSGANFRMPANYSDDSGEFNGRYTISVKSVGGMSLNGVKVSAKKGNTTVREGVSQSGYINLTMEPDVYQLVVDPDTLPEGYYVDDTQVYTSASDGKVEIAIPSRVIDYGATSGTTYSVGDVMHNFAFTDAVTGRKYELSRLLDENVYGYKTVMLNFFYVSCSPCRLEFPYIEEAYKAYNDKMAIVAISYQDSSPAIKSFAEQVGLSFNMSYDSSGTTSKFGVTEFPTTVMIDRFGVVAARSTGGEFSSNYWRSLFQYFTSDDYEQTNKDDNDIEPPKEFTKPDPNLTMPASTEINAALTGEVKDGASVNRYYAEEGKDKDYSWPWIINGSGNDAYLDASNAEYHYSFSTLYADITLSSGDAISYDYYVTTQADQDVLYVLVNGNIVAQHSGNSEEWKHSLAVYVANRSETVTLAFMYYKDLTTNVDNERASIKNLNIRPVREVVDTIDVQTSIVDGLTRDKNYNHPLTGNYSITVTKNNKNGYYYYGDAILLADILNAGFWAEKHLGSATFENEEGNNTANSVYHLSYWTMSNYKLAGNDVDLTFDYLTDAQSANFIEDYYLQDFSDNKLLPVTDDLIAILNAFIDGMYDYNRDMFVQGDEKYNGQWLEFCYYYKHYGDNHDPEDEKQPECYTTLDPIKGLTYYNAYEAHLGKNEVNINKILNLCGDGGGVKFRFEPEETGVYLFYSDAHSVKGVDPKIFIYDENLNRLLEANNDMRYNSLIYSEKHDEYYAYVWLDKDKVYYVHGAMSTPGDTGSYDMFIEYKGEQTVNYLTFASVGDGVFTFNEEPYYVYYVAVNAAFKDGCYYHYYRDENGAYRFGSKIYIDFIHQNYFDRKGVTLYNMIKNGVFDFRENGGYDYTNDMMSYYQRSISGKNKDDELYGLIEADEKLVNILSFACQIWYEEGAASGAWEMFACYYEYIGNPANN